MDATIRTIRSDELEAFVHVVENAFGQEMRSSDVAVFARKVDVGRMHAAFDGQHAVGTAGVYPFNLTIPGGETAAAGITMVSVLPSHRRHGLLRAMMRAQLDDIRERGEPIAILWASEETIYQRFGYGPAAHQGRVDIERDKAKFLDDPGRSGRTRMLTLDEALKVLPSVYDRVRRDTVGMYERSSVWWENHTLLDPEHMRHGASPKFMALLEIEGAPEAYAIYRIRSRWNDDGTTRSRLEVEEALATSPVAMREIWRYLFGVDLIERVQAWYLPADFPILLMLDEPRRLRFSLSERLWLRVVDVVSALEARSYAADDAIVLEVLDDFCPWNSGRYALDGGERRAVVTDADPDLRMNVAALGATYLGGTTFSQLAAAGRVDELTPGALGRADALFRTQRAPWCPENF